MCGICGALRFDGAPVSEPALIAMRDALVHRGPDSLGIYRSPGGGSGLGFRRLRIIDLTPNASQPMPNEDGAVQVVFNGEIYNYKALREGLVARGHRFRSQSDTEVIAHLYEEKGADCVDDLVGTETVAPRNGGHDLLNSIGRTECPRYRSGMCRFTSSKKFNRNVTRTGPLSPREPSGMSSTANRLPSGATSRLDVPG
jgi:glutamine phosphoribosylpyrophosphate amidotransferase